MSELFFADLVRETTEAVGTGPLPLDGAVSGYRTFASVVPPGATFCYALFHGAAGQWETGLGSLDGEGRLVRQVRASSADGELVDFAVGEKTACLTVIADWYAERDAKSGHDHDIAQVDGLQAVLDAKSPVGHGHEIGDVAGLQVALDGKQAAGSYAPAVHAHDYLSDAPSDGGKYARSDGGWVTVQDGGGGSMPDGTAGAAGLAFADDGDTGFYRPSSNILGMTTAGIERVRIAGNGNVGVGTGSPRTALEVNGPITIGSAWPTVASSVQQISGSFQFSANALYTGAWKRYNENVPAWNLYITPDGNDSFVVRRGPSGSGPINWTTLFRILGNGNAGVGTAAPTAKLDVAGTLAAQTATTASAANVHQAQSGSVLLRSTSSLRYKRDVETMEAHYADAILACRPVWYRSTAEADNPDWGYWGLIAEEVADIDPRLVHWAYLPEHYETVEIQPPQDAVLDDDGNEIAPATEAVTERRLIEGTEKVPDGVQYERFIVPLLDLVRRQQAMLATLATRIDAMEAA